MMRVKTDMCWSGKFSCRLTLPNGTRLVINVPEETWCRAVAIRAKNLIVAETGIRRDKIRFI